MDEKEVSPRGHRDRSFSEQVVCRFFIQNKCLRGDACPYSHTLDHYENLEEEDSVVGSLVSIADASCCSICLQSVLLEGKRFGLLPLCNHVFCLDCIVTWRGRSDRRCPVCRVASFFVIPSPRFFIGDFKKNRVAEYLNFLASKPCRYYSALAEVELCPYGPMCFFHHRAGAGRCSSDRKLDLVYTDGSCDAWLINELYKNT